METFGQNSRDQKVKACDLCTTLKIIFEKKFMKIKEGEIKILALSCVQVDQGYIFKMC